MRNLFQQLIEEHIEINYTQAGLIASNQFKKFQERKDKIEKEITT